MILALGLLLTPFMSMAAEPLACPSKYRAALQCEAKEQKSLYQFDQIAVCVPSRAFLGPRATESKVAVSLDGELDLFDGTVTKDAEGLAVDFATKNSVIEYQLTTTDHLAELAISTNGELETVEYDCK